MRRRSARVGLGIAVILLCLDLGASVAFAHDCASQADCEETTGYVGGIATVGGIIAIITAILGTEFGRPFSPGSATATEARPEAKPKAPQREGIWDPWAGKPLVEWDPEKHAPGPNGQGGKPGWVWWNGDWTSPDKAREQIDEWRQQDERRDRESEEFHRESRRLSEEHIKKRREQLEQEADDERKRREAEELLDKIRETARGRDDDEIWRRTLDPAAGGKGGSLYDEDGNLKPEEVEKLRDVMVNRIRRGQGEPEEPPQHWLAEGAADTWRDARRNPWIRIGTGILTGGVSEIGYAGGTAWDAMQERHDELNRQGKGGSFDWTDAVRAGVGGVAEEMLPTNTINTLKDPNATWKDIAVSVGGDVLAVVDGADALKGLRGGKGVGWDDLNRVSRGDPIEQLGKGTDPAKWPGVKHVDDVEAVRARDPRGLPDGAPVRPHDYGMGVDQGRHARQVADKYGVEIDVRPANKDALKRLGEGDIPKPAKIKAKTLNEVDELIGAPKGERGRVGFFEPQKPANFEQLDPQVKAQVQQRFDQRAKEFQDLSKDIKVLQGAGDIRIEKGGVLIDNATGKAFTGDLDVFSIKGPGGTELPRDVKAQVIADLRKPPFNAQHGAHTDWEFNPLDKDHGEMNSGINEKIRADAQETPNMRFRPDEPPKAARHYEGLDRVNADAAKLGDQRKAEFEAYAEDTQKMSREEVQGYMDDIREKRFGS